MMSREGNGNREGEWKRQEEGKTKCPLASSETLFADVQCTALHCSTANLHTDVQCTAMS